MVREKRKERKNFLIFTSEFGAFALFALFADIKSLAFIGVSRVAAGGLNILRSFVG
jgi:hypothetical protein